MVSYGIVDHHSNTDLAGFRLRCSLDQSTRSICEGSVVAECLFHTGFARTLILKLGVKGVSGSHAGQVEAIPPQIAECCAETCEAQVVSTAKFL
jgi:hypothetical protein